MATLDQLSDEQRAIIELVLQQGKSYDELSEMLGLPERRVRDLARDALVDLAPLSARGVEEDWRGQLADYVLRQQAGPEVTATRGHLRRSEAARVWTRSLLDSLEQLYRNGDLPAVPEGERGRARAARQSSATGVGGEAVKRRRILAAGGVVALLLVGLLVWPLGLLTGGDADDGRASSANDPQPRAAAGQGGAVSDQTEGEAIIAKQGDATQLVVTATGLEPSTQQNAYQVWLYNSANDRRSLGATVTDPQGALRSGGRLPADYRDYQFIDVTSVTIKGEQSFKTGPSVLRGLLELRDNPVARGTGKKRITLLAEIRLRPLLPPGG